MPTLAEDGWQLESGVERHAEAPDTFEMPDEAIRSRLVPTCTAKLIFTLRGADGPRVERMWVEITGYTDTGYVGVLNNEPHARRSDRTRSSRRVRSRSQHRRAPASRLEPGNPGVRGLARAAASMHEEHRLRSACARTPRARGEISPSADRADRAPTGERTRGSD